MIKKLFITIALVFIANVSSAVTIDLPDYDFADIARSASVTSSGANAFSYSYNSAVDDITDIYATSYMFSNSANATINLVFGTDVYNGDGFDISIFFVGGDERGHSFGLSLTDNPDTYPDVLNFDSTTYAHYEYTGFSLKQSGYSIFRMDIDLDQFGALGDSPIGTLSFDVSNSSAVLSLVGAYHLEPAAAVPLPLPIVLFGSGLALLGFVGRRKQ